MSDPIKKTISILVGMDGDTATALRQRMIEENDVERVLSWFLEGALRNAKIPPWRPSGSPIPIEWPEAWFNASETEAQPFVLNECHYGIVLTLGDDTVYVPTKIRVLPGGNENSAEGT